MSNLEDIISGKDPLNRDAAIFLTKYREEDNRVDYKLTVDLDSEKEWLSLTKDISAFANTLGGYLVFGIDDNKKEILGLSKKVSDLLKDANNLQLKINRHLEPDISTLRSKSFRFDGKTIVILYVPQSNNVSHFIKKEGSFAQQSGKSKTILRKGTFYVRRSAGNHLGDSRDLDDVVERRIDRFRNSLYDKIARVVKTPAESSLFIVSKDPEDTSGEKYIIEDSPDSIPVKGMSFSVSPQEGEQEVAAWTALSKGKSSIIPPENIIWKWYSQRENLVLRPVYKLSLFQFSLWVSAPAFYWIIGLENSVIRKVLLTAIRNRPIGSDLEQPLIAACFLGKATHKAALQSLGGYIDKIPERYKSFPIAGPRKEYGTIETDKKQTLANLKKELIRELNEMVAAVAEKHRNPKTREKWKAQKIDRFLYTQDNNYK